MVPGILGPAHTLVVVKWWLWSSFSLWFVCGSMYVGPCGSMRGPLIEGCGPPSVCGSISPPAPPRLRAVVVAQIVSQSLFMSGAIKPPAARPMSSSCPTKPSSIIPRQIWIDIIAASNNDIRIISTDIIAQLANTHRPLWSFNQGLCCGVVGVDSYGL